MQLLGKSSQSPTAWQRAKLAISAGAGLIGYLYSGSYAANTVGAFLQQVARIKPTIAALRGLDKTKNPWAYVLGYYAAGDGGGGFYYYDSTDTTSSDNGGTIIVGADGGRWKLSTQHSYTIRQFGAKGDGSNDSAAFAAAIAAAPSTGCEIIFTPGTYTGTLVLNKSFVTIRAAGAVIKAPAGTTSQVVLMQISGGILAKSRIFDLQIDGNGEDCIGVNIVRAVDCEFSHGHIKNAKSHGLQITGDGVGACTHITARSNRIDAHASRNAGAHGIHIGGGGVNAALRLYDNYVTGYSVTVNDAGVNTVDVGGIGESGTTYAATSGGDGVFIGNWVEGGSYSGAYYTIGDSRTTIIGAHDTGISNIASSAAGQFPARGNKILLQDAAVLGNIVVPDGGIQYYSGNIGGSILANAPQNLGGTLQITGTNTTGTVTFTNQEPDNTYRVFITVAGRSGGLATPVVTDISQTQNGFTVTISAAPGIGNTLTYNWMIVR